MLIIGRNFRKLHARWAAGTVLIAVAAVAWTIVVALRTGRWPGGGSLSGLVLGIAAGLIFLFELALLLKRLPATRKGRDNRRSWLGLRTARWTGSAQLWMKAHIWLGLLTVPLVVLHSGGRLGGTLTTVFAALFVLVIASGLWGLVLQNLLPRMLLDAVPTETIYSEIDRVGEQYAAEARRLVQLACADESRSMGKWPATTTQEPAANASASLISGAPRVVGPQVQWSPHPATALPRTIESRAVHEALQGAIGPFLTSGRCRPRLLGSKQRNEWYFQDLRLRVVPELRSLVDQLEELCERRRQLNLQRRIHFWLHNWLWLHLPLSIALVILLVAHVAFAIRFD